MGGMIPHLKQNKMTNQEFRKLQKEIQDNLYDWAEDNFGSWDEFVDYSHIDGKEFYLPISLVPPHTAKEWNEAKAGNSYTDGLIEVTDYSYRGILSGFCIHDGHNRLKTFINNGDKEIKVIFGK